jgi:hypothetical protein
MKSIRGNMGWLISGIGGLLIGICVSIFSFSKKSKEADENARSSVSQTHVDGAIGPQVSRGDTIPLDEAAIRKRIQTKTKQMRDSGVISPKNAPNYVLVGPNCQLTDQAIKAAGLSGDQITAAQKSIDNALNKISDIIAASAVYDESKSDPESGKFHFKVPAFGDTGKAIAEDLKQNLAAVAGDSAEALVSSFQPSSYAMGFGKYNAEITFMSDPQDGSHELKASYVFTNPEGGALIMRGETGQSNFRRIFGSSLETRLAPAE